MKKIALLLIVNLMIVSSFGQRTKYIKTSEDSLAYAIGISMYENVKGLDVDLDLKIISKGMNAAAEDEGIFSIEEAMAFIQQYMTVMQEKKSQENKAAGIKFLEENKHAEGVVVTKSGLQYIVLEEGTGAKPATNDKVKVHYTGYLLDGTKFDSSVDRGEPAVFGVTQVIKGWTEVLQLMPEGSKYKVFIPSDLAYGDRGAGADIKPGSVLMFEIELIEIQ